MTDYAIIDIGSNSIRYGASREGRIIEKSIHTTRLGLGLQKSGMLAEDRMKHSLEVLSMLAKRAAEDGLRPHAYATSAVRDAENGREFAKKVENVCGIPVRILTGEQEARYAYIGAVGSGTDYDTLLDIGGASMQIVNCDRGVSFRAGCVRCGDIAREFTSAPDCDTAWSLQRREIEKYLDSIMDTSGFDIKRLVGVGGTITTLAALKAGLEVFSVEAVERVVLTARDVDELIEKLGIMGSERRKHPMLIKRHDVIMYGACILRFAMERLGVDNIGISCSDGMDGFLRVLMADEEK